LVFVIVTVVKFHFEEFGLDGDAREFSAKFVMRKEMIS